MFVLFTLNGQFLKKISTSRHGYFSSPKIDSRGNFYASIIYIQKKPINELKKFNSQLEPLFTIATIDLTEKLKVYNPFFPKFYWAIRKEDNLIWGISSEYELKIFDYKGKLIKKIIKNYRPIKITEKEKREIIRQKFGSKGPPDRKVKFPKYYPPFMNLSVDEKGRIFLGTYEKVKGKKGFYYYDVFDSEGKYIAKVPIKAGPNSFLIWKNAKLYIIDETEEGFPIIKRYKVIWY